jgi:hypothetical protein
MNWLKKIPHSIRSASGLEWVLWRKLPLIALMGTLLPLLGLGVLYTLTDPDASANAARAIQLARYVVAAIIVFHWSMVLTAAVGCVIVMVMKGPGYQADSYPLSHSDQPRNDPQSAEEAARYRNTDAPP